MFDFLSQKFSGILSWMSNKTTLSEKNINDAIEQVREALLQADVPYDIVNQFLSNVSNEAIGKKAGKNLTTGNQFIKIVNEKLIEFLTDSNNSNSDNNNINNKLIGVVIVMGLQGSGKTTTVAKLAKFIKNNFKNKKILIGSTDFYRPAAIEQLEILAQKVNVDFFKSNNNDPIDTSKQIYNFYKNNKYDILFLDTAGRLHIEDKMMDELKEIKNIVNPKISILVLDSMTGQESLNVAKSFDNRIGFSSAILSKMDSDTRGGAAFSFRYSIKKPIIFLGTGEKLDDLESFIPKRIASRMLGMGDVLSLIEKASEKIPEKKQANLTKRIMSGKFNLEDFESQMNMMGKMGSLQKILKYLPGAHSVSSDMIEKGEAEMKEFKAIISSMTRKEKLFPNMLDKSRKKRIARGSGTKVEIINQLLQKFEQSKQFAKMFKKMN